MLWGVVSRHFGEWRKGVQSPDCTLTTSPPMKEYWAYPARPKRKGSTGLLWSVLCPPGQRFDLSANLSYIGDGPEIKEPSLGVDLRCPNPGIKNDPLPPFREN